MGLGFKDVEVEACAALALAALFVLGGCAVHAPMSETVLFHDYATEPAHDEALGFGYAPLLDQPVFGVAFTVGQF